MLSLSIFQRFGFIILASAEVSFSLAYSFPSSRPFTPINYFSVFCLLADIPHRLKGRAAQLWKERDRLAQKQGVCQTVYWVKPKPPQTMNISLANKEDTSKWMTGATYKGEWLQNKHHGFGIKTWANGNQYEGEFKMGMRDGHGTFWVKEKAETKKADTLTKSGSNPSTPSSPSSTTPTATASGTSKVLPDGTRHRKVYTGNWVKDMMDGLGVHYYKDGSRYVRIIGIIIHVYMLLFYAMLLCIDSCTILCPT